MNETPNTRTAEFFDAMVATYETWAEPLSARLAKAALKRTSVRAGDSVLDIGAGTGAFGTSGSCPRGEGHCYRYFVRYGRSVNPTPGSLSGM